MCTDLTLVTGARMTIVNDIRNGSLLPIFNLSCCKGCFYINTHCLLITNIISYRIKKKKRRKIAVPSFCFDPYFVDMTLLL